LYGCVGKRVYGNEEELYYDGEEHKKGGFPFGKRGLGFV
jgi:hypothetical protein